MKDRFTEALEELQQKSAFVCDSCDDSHTIVGTEMPSSSMGESLHDRFTEAVGESGEKSAFVCESCR